MLKYGNRDFRNLQQQVYANMKNIQDIIDGSNIIADLKTLTIVGQVATAAELPDPETYTGSYGDAFIVGEDGDTEVYVFTKAYEEENAPQWFDLGVFPQPGPQGERGAQIGYSSTSIAYGQTQIPLSSVTAEYDVAPGDILVTINGYVFNVASVSDTTVTGSAVTNITGPQGETGATGATGQTGAQGPAGADGSKIYYGTDVVYVPGPPEYYQIFVSDVPDIKVGDYYLTSTSYVSFGHTIDAGLLFTVISKVSSVAAVAEVMSLVGPQGTPGVDGTDGTDGTDGERGSLWFSGNDLTESIVIPGEVWWDERDFPSGYQPNIDDYYLVTSTYSATTVNFENGDIYKVSDIGSGGAEMTYVTNIAGASSWGSITGTLSNQTDLQNALNGKLSLSGGTMTGAITVPTGVFLKDASNNNILAQSAQYTTLGTDAKRVVISSSSYDIEHNRQGTTVNVLDGANTSANPTLVGTESDLTALKINGTSYKVAVANALTLPDTAPAAQKIVGINTSGQQNALGVGEGLAVEDNNITLKRLTLDFNGSTTYQLTAAISTKINNNEYDEIIILNYKNTTSKNKLIFTLDSDIKSAFNNAVNSLSFDTGYSRYHLKGSYIMPNIASNTSSDFYESSTGIPRGLISYEIYLKITTVSGNDVLALNSQAKQNINQYYNLRKTITLTSTTQTGTLDYPYFDQQAVVRFDESNSSKALFDICIPVLDYIDSENPYNVYLRVRYSKPETAGGTAYFYGERFDPTTGAVTYKYTLAVTTGTKAYTLTRIAI